jgi:hypothetical protein
MVVAFIERADDAYTVALSASHDGGVQWSRSYHLEPALDTQPTGGSERSDSKLNRNTPAVRFYSPAVAAGQDGVVHVCYVWGGRALRYVSLSQHWLLKTLQ